MHLHTWACMHTCSHPPTRVNPLMFMEETYMAHFGEILLVNL
jgi:hypothetical protein